MSADQPGAEQVLDAVNGMVRVVLDRAAELGVEVTAEQLASNLLPNLGHLAGDMVAYVREHGSLDGAELALVPATAEQDDADGLDY